MFTLDHHLVRTLAPVRSPFAVRVANAISTFFRAWKNRRDLYRLGEISDAELAETRTDIHVVIQSPFAIDPTVRHGAIVRARIEGGFRIRRSATAAFDR